MLKKGTWKTYGLWIGVSLAIGGLSGLLNRAGMKAFAEIPQPPLSPPGWLFPIVWTILYTLMGIGMAWVLLEDCPRDKRDAVGSYFVQLILNFFWSFWFFRFSAYLFSFIWLLLLLVAAVIMAIRFGQIKRSAGWLQLPYLLWLTFAAYLNFGVYLLNR